LGAGFLPVTVPDEGAPVPPRAATAPEPLSESTGGSAPVISGATFQSGPDPALEAAIERAVARQIGPLREQLLAAQERVLLRDVLGGLGYILGLTGLALWWTSRGRARPR
jgi:hypothetical protein